MDYEKEEHELTIPIRFKNLTCQVNECIYNNRPSCKHEWVELDDNGTCIFKEEQCQKN